MATRIHRGNKRRRAIYLKEWREHLNLTQDQLAERMETSKARVSRIESGARPYKEDFVAAAAWAMGIEERDLFRHPESVSIDDMLEKAPDPVKKQAHALIETLLKTGS